MLVIAGFPPTEEGGVSPTQNRKGKYVPSLISEKFIKIIGLFTRIRVKFTRRIGMKMNAFV